MKSINVDLTRDPGDRWNFSNDDIRDARRLMDTYSTDIGGVEQHRDALEMYDMSGKLDGEYRAEINAVSMAIDRSYLTVLLGNVYYDALKLVMGSGTSGFACSAYAVDTPNGPVHAPNLDWWTDDNRVLSTGSRIIEFTGAPAGNFKIIGWPGYLGGLSAIAPGRFSITLNTVTSEDPFQMAAPISFVIRDALQTASTFAEAVERFSTTPLMCDCLMLVAGVKAGEMVVVERSPSRSAGRQAVDVFIAVTNHYRHLGSRPSGYPDLAGTSCERYDRIEELMSMQRQRAPYELMSILSDSRIKMATMTVQQMVMCPATGELMASAS